MACIHGIDFSIPLIIEYFALGYTPQLFRKRRTQDSIDLAKSDGTYIIKLDGIGLRSFLDLVKNDVPYS